MDSQENKIALRALNDSQEVAIKQNDRILDQLERVEEKVDYTNGTVKEHTAALAAIALRHQAEDKRSERLIKAVWTLIGTILSAIALLVVAWISHAQGWTH